MGHHENLVEQKDVILLHDRSLAIVMLLYENVHQQYFRINFCF